MVEAYVAVFFELRHIWFCSEKNKHKKTARREKQCEDRKLSNRFEQIENSIDKTR